MSSHHRADQQVVLNIFMTRQVKSVPFMRKTPISPNWIYRNCYLHHSYLTLPSNRQLTPYSSYGFNFFFPTLVQGLGYGDENTSLLLTAPPYFLGAICSFLVSWNSDRIKERGFHITCALGAAATGFIITLATTNLDARYAASFLYAPGSFSANALVYAWAVSTLSSTPEKRAAAGAIVNIFGRIVSPLPSPP